MLSSRKHDLQLSEHVNLWLAHCAGAPGNHIGVDFMIMIARKFEDLLVQTLFV